MQLTYVDIFFFFFFNDTATTEIYTLSLHDALPISTRADWSEAFELVPSLQIVYVWRSEEHTSDLQSQFHLVCRLLLEKKKKNILSIIRKNKKKKEKNKKNKNRTD